MHIANRYRRAVGCLRPGGSGDAGRVAACASASMRSLLHFLSPYLVSVATGLLLATGAAFQPAALRRSPTSAIRRASGTCSPAHTGTFLRGTDCLQRSCMRGCRCGDSARSCPRPRAPLATGLRNLIVASRLHSFLSTASRWPRPLLPDRVWVGSLRWRSACTRFPIVSGDFAVLLHAGYTATSALRMAVLPSLGRATRSGFGCCLRAPVEARRSTGCLFLPISAASFLYIACVNLLPELRHQHSRLGIALQVLCLFGGVALVCACRRIARRIAAQRPRAATDIQLLIFGSSNARYQNLLRGGRSAVCHTNVVFSCMQ